MARPVRDPKRSRTESSFNSVVNKICQGQYVLVLGSDVMFDIYSDPDDEGDSTKFFLDKVIQIKQEEGKNYSSVNSFQEFILDNGLNPMAVRRWLSDAIESAEIEKEWLNPDLMSLVKTKCFRVVLTTTFDPAVEKLMDEVWGKDEYRKMSIYNNPGQDFDLDMDDIKGDEYFDIKPVLYYVFGKADPYNPDMKFVLDDNDTLECISKWLGKGAPERLLTYIDSKDMLVLGCNLKDWCFRFFWYAMRHRNTNKLHDGDIAVLLQPEKSEQDSNLYNYLRNTINVRLQTNSREFIQRLSHALDEKKVAQDALLLSKQGGIFISYAHEDFSIAWNVFTRLRKEGFNVWLDNTLEVSDDYNTRIENAINQCKVFMPILSPGIVKAIESGEDRYVKKEWALATGPNADKKYFPIVTSDYDCHGSFHQNLPEKMQVSVFNWVNEPFANLISKLKSEFHLWQK